jgi:hypothetical protein
MRLNETAGAADAERRSRNHTEREDRRQKNLGTEKFFLSLFQLVGAATASETHLFQTTYKNPRSPRAKWGMSGAEKTRFSVSFSASVAPLRLNLRFDCGLGSKRNGDIS